MSDHAIKTWPAAQLNPRPAIGRESFRLDPEESARRGRRISVYRALSGSRAGKQHTLVYNGNTDSWYCSCEAGEHDRLCRHVTGAAYWIRWLVAWCGYIHMTTPELEQRRRDFVRTERGVLVPYRHWEIDRDALLCVLAERGVRGAA
jgi:hypothetical protein